jgi:hypothetical protein
MRWYLLGNAVTGVAGLQVVRDGWKRVLCSISVAEGLFALLADPVYKDSILTGAGHPDAQSAWMRWRRRSHGWGHKKIRSRIPVAGSYRTTRSRCAIHVLYRNGISAEVSGGRGLSAARYAVWRRSLEVAPGMAAYGRGLECGRRGAFEGQARTAFCAVGSGTPRAHATVRTRDGILHL